MIRTLVIFSIVCLMSLSFMTHTADAQEEILGPWLWLFAPTVAGQGGQNSTNIDTLAANSEDAVTEDKVVQNGAIEGDAVGDYEWIEGTLPADGNINVMFVDLGVTGNADFNDVTSYALIMLKSAEEQKGVTMSTGSDDSIKVWVNGVDVFTNATNRGRAKYQDSFQIDLIKGENLVMVKVSERTGGWGMHVGIEAEVEHHLDFEKYLPVELDGKLATQWADIKKSH